jgi:hypothetical protein
MWALQLVLSKACPRGEPVRKISYNHLAVCCFDMSNRNIDDIPTLGIPQCYRYWSQQFYVFHYCRLCCVCRARPLGVP